eukprot:scaffold103815_cov28-Tisochrysis_lutea.AAC.3
MQSRLATWQAEDTPPVDMQTAYSVSPRRAMFNPLENCAEHRLLRWHPQIVHTQQFEQYREGQIHKIIVLSSVPKVHLECFYAVLHDGTAMHGIRRREQCAAIGRRDLLLEESAACSAAATARGRDRMVSLAGPCTSRPITPVLVSWKGNTHSWARSKTSYRSATR